MRVLNPENGKVLSEIKQNRDQSPENFNPRDKQGKSSIHENPYLKRSIIKRSKCKNFNPKKTNVPRFQSSKANTANVIIKIPNYYKWKKPQRLMFKEFNQQKTNVSKLHSSRQLILKKLHHKKTENLQNFNPQETNVSRAFIIKRQRLKNSLQEIYVSKISIRKKLPYKEYIHQNINISIVRSSRDQCFNI